jgi:O-antigen/teichoic acid export membrane protein
MFVLYCERDRLILLIYGPHYQEAVWLQQYLVITISFAFLHNLAAFLMMTMRRERLLLIFYLGGLLFNLLWCSQIMPVMPLLGAALAIILTKAFVGSLTITYIHRRVGLFTQSTLSPLLVALVIGTLLYVATKAYLLRIPAEALGLAPLLILAGYWWRKQPRKS